MKKFNTIEDAELFCIDEGLIKIDEIGRYSINELKEVAESMTDEAESNRDSMRDRMVDHTKSREAKRNWKLKRQRYMHAIDRFHKSVKGNRVHQKIAKARRDGSLSNIHEEITTLNSVITRLAINASYNSSIADEASRVALFHEGVSILTPVLHDMIYENVRLQDRLEMDESGEFIDDLFKLLDKHYGGAEDPESTDESDPQESSDPDQSTELDPAVDANSDDEVEDADVTAKDASVLTGQDFSDNGKLLSLNLLRNNPEKVDEDYENMSFESDSSINESFGSDFVMISEAAGDPDVDGVHVIGKIVGPAFFPGTISRNRVEYTKELWDSVLANPETRSELDARRVFGTFGHELEINDEALRAGAVSHIVKDIYYDNKGVGIGEYLILNTEPGRNLRTYLGAKCKLRVSTRCRGKFKTMSNRNGCKEPDPKFFKFQGIDFVHDPGYLAAEPTLVS